MTLRKIYFVEVISHNCGEFYLLPTIPNTLIEVMNNNFSKFYYQFIPITFILKEDEYRKPHEREINVFGAYGLARIVTEILAFKEEQFIKNMIIKPTFAEIFCSIS